MKHITHVMFRYIYISWTATCTAQLILLFTIQTVKYYSKVITSDILPSHDQQFFISASEGSLKGVDVIWEFPCLRMGIDFIFMNIFVFIKDPFVVYSIFGLYLFIIIDAKP